MNKFFKWIGVFESNLTAAEYIGRIISLLFIGGGGTLSTYLAKTSPLFAELGPLAWLGVGALTMFIFSLILLIFQIANKQSKEAEYLKALSSNKMDINPLATSFENQIITIEQLKLPRVQVHENKQFRRCHFVGPGVIAILGGGTITHCGFFYTGDIIPLPSNTCLTGLTIFRNCTLIECEFHRVTIIGDAGICDAFRAMEGVQIAGEND